MRSQCAARRFAPTRAQPHTCVMPAVPQQASPSRLAREVCGQHGGRGGGVETCVLCFLAVPVQLEALKRQSGREDVCAWGALHAADQAGRWGGIGRRRRRQGQGQWPFETTVNNFLSLCVLLCFCVNNCAALQWVAGIKKTALRGTPPFLSLSTALIHPTPWFLSSGRRGTQARAPARRIFR